MGGVRFSELQSRPMECLDLTSVELQSRPMECLDLTSVTRGS